MLYRKDSEPLYHSVMYSLVSYLSVIYPLHVHRSLKIISKLVGNKPKWKNSGVRVDEIPLHVLRQWHSVTCATCIGIVAFTALSIHGFLLFCCSIVYRQISWHHNIAKNKTWTLVPFPARLAHRYPQGWFSKFIHFASNFMLTFRFRALSRSPFLF